VSEEEIASRPAHRTRLHRIAKARRAAPAGASDERERDAPFLDLTEISRPSCADDRGEPRHEGEAQRKGAPACPLAGRTLATIFDRPRPARVSFDVAVRQLGGESITLTSHDMQLGRGETIADTARVLRHVDAIMIRTLEHETLIELAEYATVL
jgi:ornithine carbamoyltransferase